MSVIARGAKNAFRNWMRTAAVVIILAIGIGLSLSMLVARQAVEARINDLKSQVGTTLVVNPAGSRGFEGGGEPLTNDQLNAIKTVAHVSSANASINFVLRNQSDSGNTGNVRIGFPGSQSSTSGTTNLQSSIDAGTLGRRFAGADANQTPPSLPIRGVGTDANMDGQGTAFKITSGRGLQSGDTLSALIGSDLATKNNLKVGSTFTAYDKTFTIAGIFDQGTKFENDMVVFPLAEAQTLSNQANQVGTILVTVDSIENLTAASDAIKAKLGSGKADVSSTQANLQTAIDSLQSVQGVALIGFVASLVAAAVITLLIMTVIVRERRREIGVLKAIGGSNRTIVSQFVVEAVVLVFMGAIVGLGFALVGSNSIANALVKSGTSESSSSTSGRSGPVATFGGGGGLGRAVRFDGRGLQNTSNLIGQVSAAVGPLTLLWGLLAALGIAIVGSALPAWFIAKVRPAIVLRGE